MDSHSMAYNLPAFHLEIQTADRKQVALLKVTDHVEQLSFSNILGALRHFIPDLDCAPTTAAFQYVDEDNDVITVRSEDETSTMLQNYIATKFDQAATTFHSTLVIFPYVSKKSSIQRNIHGLKVSTAVPSPPTGSSPGSSGRLPSQASSSSSSPAMGAPGLIGSGQMENSRLSGGSGKQDPGDITQLLGGKLGVEQLEYDAVRDRLGSGNGGVVFRARHRQSGKVMALKRIRLDISEEKQSQIINELSILHRCHSPFIISFFGSFFHDNEIHIATELMDGGSLDLYGVINEPVLGRVAVMVIHGLQYLWQQKIMHRDVKSSNMLVNSQGVVKLCDFGVSVQLVRSVTQTFCGTNAYMSPERLIGTAYRIESDLWSLGVSLYEMAMGSLPFQFNPHKPLDLMNHITTGHAAQLPQDQFTDSFVLFVSQCLQKEPEARPNPRVLMEHAFVRQYNDGNVDVVSAWVRAKFPEVQFKLKKRC